MFTITRTCTRSSGERERKLKKKVKIYNYIQHRAQKEIWKGDIVLIFEAGLEAIIGPDFLLLLTILYALYFQPSPL